ncbi:MAG: hypothetical protein IIW00_02170, partial [Alistipes sp.]|nr:hypothetical protein [Alistipes sp.]
MKINISFILATHNNTPSYKQKQSAEGAFLVGELSAARRRKAHTTKKRKVKTLRLLLGWKMGFERRSRSEDTFENKYLFYPRNPQQHS